MHTLAFWIVFLFPIGLMGGYFLSLQFFFRVLKKEDPKLWDELGRPYIPSNTSIGSGLAVLSAFATSSYKSSTPQVRRAGNIARAMMFIAVVGLVAYPFLTKFLGISFHS